MSKAIDKMDALIHEVDVMAAQDRLERIQATFPEIRLTPLKARTLLVIMDFKATVIDEVLYGIGLSEGP